MYYTDHTTPRASSLSIQNLPPTAFLPWPHLLRLEVMPLGPYYIILVSFEEYSTSQTSIVPKSYLYVATSEYKHKTLSTYSHTVNLLSPTNKDVAFPPPYCKASTKTAR